MRSSVLFLVGACLAATGCIHTRRVALGPPVPARAADCEIHFEHLDPTEATLKLQQVGTVCITDGQVGGTVDSIYLQSGTRDALRADACALGGEVVSPVGLCNNDRVGGYEFGVYRARD